MKAYDTSFPFEANFWRDSPPSRGHLFVVGGMCENIDGPKTVGTGHGTSQQIVEDLFFFSAYLASKSPEQGRGCIYSYVPSVRPCLD